MDGTNLRFEIFSKQLTTLTKDDDEIRNHSVPERRSDPGAKKQNDAGNRQINARTISLQLHGRCEAKGERLIISILTELKNVNSISSVFLSCVSYQRQRPRPSTWRRRWPRKRRRIRFLVDCPIDLGEIFSEWPTAEFGRPTRTREATCNKPPPEWGPCTTTAKTKYKIWRNKRGSDSRAGKRGSRLSRMT